MMYTRTLSEMMPLVDRRYATFVHLGRSEACDPKNTWLGS